MAHVLAVFKEQTKENQSEAVSLASELGLDRQAERYSKNRVEDAFKALSRDELEIWDSFCSCHYGVKTQPKSLSDYSFDTVPVEVMRHWKNIKDNYSFDEYQIWTTEKAQITDPLLIGFLGNSRYLLARWGLESPESLPLRDVAKNLYKNMIENNYSMFTRGGFLGLRKLTPQQIEEKTVDFILYRRGYSLFKACMRVMGLEIPARKFNWSYCD